MLSVADTKALQQLYEKYKMSVALVEVRTSTGDTACGSAFHVGNGVFVTARHVVEHNTITDLLATEGTWFNHRPTPTDFPRQGGLEFADGPYLHPKPHVDVACFRIRELPFDKAYPYPPAIPLGGHLDEWMDDGFTCSTALVLGYPPVPLSRAPDLFAVPATVSTVVGKLRLGDVAPEEEDENEDPRFGGLFFILSCTARGGFSGGPALCEWGGFSLGVVTEAFVRDGQPLETGFLGVLSVEPIYECLAEHGLLPPEQLTWLGEGRDELFGGRERYARCLKIEPAM